ncbi:MAG TPA: tetratricopeptide repeat protein [Bacteroidetes bacterium]|nr:tetratricopeptide repeat protein [Bacteroidota bacterium]
MGNKGRRFVGRIIYLLFLLLMSGRGAWAQEKGVQELDSLEKLARKYYRSDLDSSRYFADKIQASAIEQKNFEKVAWALNWKAICFLKNGLSDSVSLYLEKCIAYCEANGVDEVKGKARLNQAINFLQKGDYEAGAKSGMQALRHFEKIGDTLGSAHARYNTGLNYHRMDRFEEAKALYDEALPIYLERGGVLDRANTLNAIGAIWKVWEELDSALVFHEKAVAEKLAVKAWAYCGAEYSNIASIWEQKGEMEKAEENYTRSYKAYAAIGDLRGTALVAGNLSKFKLVTNDWDSAVYYGKISAEFAVDSDDRFLLSQSHKRLSEAYRAQGKYKEALFHIQAYDSIHGQISSAEVQRNVDELHIQYETEKREKELLNERYLSQRKSFWLIGSVAGILGLIVAILFLYRSEQEKKKRLVVAAQIGLEAERNRISMDLHDHIGAELTIITSRLDAQAFRMQDQEVGGKLAKLADQAREASSQLRETIWSARSTSVSLEQFCLKVREFSVRILAESPLVLESECVGQVDLAPAQALDLFRVVQEGIHNAQKYSGAKTIRFLAKMEGANLVLVVSDDGQGFSQATITPGYGLTNMRERIIQLGGEFTIESGAGTTIHIRVPVKA